MMESYFVHYKNKYPGCRIFQSEEALDVYTAGGEHAVALRKNGAGQWVDISEKMGCRDRHDLAPIPKDARLFKMRDGKFSADEAHEERLEKHKAYVCKQRGDVVLSCDELSKKHGKKFDEKQKEIA